MIESLGPHHGRKLSVDPQLLATAILQFGTAVGIAAYLIRTRKR